MKTKLKLSFLPHKVKNSGMLRELLMTFLGTTLSIILTFGTSHLLDEQKKQDAGRQLAMMVIHDIDKSIDVVKEMLKAEEEGQRVTLFALNRLDSLETVPIDTLSKFVSYVTDLASSSFTEFDKSVETIFDNSPDSWNADENMAFVSKVQSFYQIRSFFEKAVKSHYYFRKPITDAECYEALMVDGLKYASNADFYATCRRWLNDPRIRNYVKYSQYRRYFLSDEVISQFVSINENNKFLMDITDDEMAEFVKTTINSVRTASDDELEGLWQSVNTNSRIVDDVELSSNHTFAKHGVLHVEDSLFRGRLKVTLSISGKWAVEDDSLVQYYDAGSARIAVDADSITYSDKNAGAVQALIKDIRSEKSCKDIAAEYVPNNRRSFATNISASGDKLELTAPGKAVSHFKRIK